MPETLDIQTHKALFVSEKQRPDVLRVNEIFHSIQGESTRAGEPCVFVRMTGCGLRCGYCDTEYAFYEGEDFGISDIVERVESYGCKLVELTGGEPLEQEGVYALIDELLRHRYEIMLETGGHMDISHVDPRVKRIVDLKTPSSGMMKRNRYENIAELTEHDEVKFVIGTREDYEWSKQQIEKYFLQNMVGAMLFSPVQGVLAPHDLAAWILEDKLPVRMQLQMHKIIWPDVLRGV